ncbi:MAG: hypothetical protein K6E95_07115, partial [Lachnospiraceae bacterium]|nr:hypothetical protein [Lachnospiraceae bacterium]
MKKRLVNRVFSFISLLAVFSLLFSGTQALAFDIKTPTDELNATITAAANDFAAQFGLDARYE